MEQDRANRELRQRLKLQARVFQEPSGKWRVRPGALVWYGTEQKGATKLDLCMSVDTGETRPTYEEIVAWLETKARTAVRESLSLNQLQSDELVINSEIQTDP